MLEDWEPEPVPRSVVRKRVFPPRIEKFPCASQRIKRSKLNKAAISEVVNYSICLPRAVDGRLEWCEVGPSVRELRSQFLTSELGTNSCHQLAPIPPLAPSSSHGDPHLV